MAPSPTQLAEAVVLRESIDRLLLSPSDGPDQADVARLNRWARAARHAPPQLRFVDGSPRQPAVVLDAPVRKPREGACCTTAASRP